MTSTLPPIPRFVFTIFEPLALVAGWFSPTFSTEYFVNSQLPSTSPTLVWATSTWPTTQVLALQLGNVYGLLAMIGIAVLYSTTEPKVVRNFLIACAIADVGHVYVTYAVMGGKAFFDLGQWNAMAWGNIGVTLGLLITRVAYLAGLLGEDRLVGDTKTAAKKEI